MFSFMEFLELRVVLPLAGEELVARGAEAVVDLLVLLSRGETDRPPGLLDLLYLGRKRVPLVK